jgi:hypothetical protein
LAESVGEEVAALIEVGQERVLVVVGEGHVLRVASCVFGGGVAFGEAQNGADLKVYVAVGILSSRRGLRAASRLPTNRLP